MASTESVIVKINNFADEIRAIGIPLDKVILFGSYAKHEQRDDSDIDLALFSKYFSGIGFEDKQLFAGINSKREYIDIEVKTFHTLDNESSPLREIVEKTGIELIQAA
ncbi:MAG: nucleotidyltransferase domain-containing protein [Saprospiraceae bacterium]|nr:nucleotidyltransferase domain-containing protein [Saprospiraceae bacterium]